MKKPYGKVPIIGFLKSAVSVVATKALCRRQGLLEASLYAWHSKYGGMDDADAKRLKALQAEDASLKKRLAESMLENQVTREAPRKKR